MATKAPRAPGTKGQTAATPADEGETNRPAHEERIGRICGAIWRHQDDAGKEWFNVTFSRIYKDQGDRWARSDSFGKGDIPLLIKVADRCHDWLYGQKSTDEA